MNEIMDTSFSQILPPTWKWVTFSKRFENKYC